MSLVTHRDYLAHKEYYRDQMRAAKKDQLVRAALANRASPYSFLSRSLAWFGKRLIIWGSGLQRHYGRVVTSSMPRSTRPVT